MATDFDATRRLFDLPEGVIYLDGNSLGPLPSAATDRVRETIENEWGTSLIRGWNSCGWMAAPTAIGDRIARLIGAAAGTVVVGDTLSIKIYQALSAALELRPRRRIVITDSGNFPTDIYMAEGLLRSLGRAGDLLVVDPSDVAAQIEAAGDDLAAIMITEVDYRTGRRHDMADLTVRAHDVGALAIWDLAHSAGALPVDLSGVGADLAAGCTYKYLNGGPGAPAFIYVAPELVEQVSPALAGWLGHESPFAFDLDYRPGAGIERMRVGTPPIVQLAALDAALDVWDDVDMDDVRSRSIELCDRFIELVESRCPVLELVSPRAGAARGSQVSFRFEHGYAAIQALIDQGVIGDFRAPDVMRFGIAPLYVTEHDIDAAVDAIARVIDERLWDDARFTHRANVT